MSTEKLIFFKTGLPGINSNFTKNRIMGLFDKLFKNQQDISNDEITEIPWHPLTRLEQIQEIEEQSKEQPVAVFKHSTRCGISRMVLKGLEQDLRQNIPENVKLYFLDLISNREVSNEIAARFQVEHESPQLILIRDRKVLHHASHHSISAGDLEKRV